MTTKSVPKNMQPILTALSDYIFVIVGSVTPLSVDASNNLRTALVDHQDDLINILKTNLPAQKESGKKVKDPDAPKRGKTSYIYFCVEKRDEIKRANPNMSATEIIKELGRVWRENVSDKDKARYEKMSSDDKARYDSERKDYTPSPNVGEAVEKKVKSGPKRALTGYIYFCNEQRSILKDENANLTTKEITSELGKRWNSLSEKERKPYDKLAAKDKIRYEKEKENWVEPDVGSEKKASKSKSKSKKDDASPRRRSGYLIYRQEFRPVIKEENPEWTNQQITKELGRSWKELSENEQAVYNNRTESESPAPKEDKKTSTKKTSAKKVSKKVSKKVEVEEESDFDDLVEEDDDDDDSE